MPLVNTGHFQVHVPDRCLIRYRSLMPIQYQSHYPFCVILLGNNLEMFLNECRMTSSPAEFLDGLSQMSRGEASFTKMCVNGIDGLTDWDANSQSTCIRWFFHQGGIMMSIGVDGNGAISPKIQRDIRSIIDSLTTPPGSTARSPAPRPRRAPP
ncbi:MAG: hypothetical protein NTW19_21840 [Planctomycetota bacterium]|nr:hypothetical protein [Planctomycetota bacterium]